MEPYPHADLYMPKAHNKELTMYKAIKEDKIIAISDTDSEFPCMVKDSVVEDTEHTAEDYSQLITGEYLLKSEMPADPKKAAVRAVRDAYINDIEWRVSRYRDQAELEIPTTDTHETYVKILQYMQYLRDYPESTWNWYENNPLTFDEWNNEN